MTVSLIDVSTYLPGEPVPRGLLRAVRRIRRAARQLDVPRPEIPPPRRRGRDSDRHGRARRRRSGGPPRPRRPRRRRCADHPHPDARHAVLRRRWRDGPPAGHETQLGDRPAQRWLRGVRARLEDGGHTAGKWAGPLCVDRGGTKRCGANLHPTHSAPEGSSGGARRRSRGGAGDRIGSSRRSSTWSVAPTANTRGT